MDALLEFVRPLLLPVLGIVCLFSAIVFIHSASKLSDTHLHSRPSPRQRFVFWMFPVLVFAKNNQPREKWKHIDRFAYGLGVFLLCLAALAFLKGS
jgi:hypothetical protein